MTEQYLTEYNAELHSGGPIPVYTESHIVKDRIPLTEVTFDPVDDEIPQVRAARDATTCPRLGSLEAVASSPQIINLERRQRLNVACPLRRQATGDYIMTQGVCALKAAAEGISLEGVVNRQLIEKIRCPFENLGARVIAGEVEVPVTIDAQWRPELPRYTGRTAEFK